MTKSVLKREKLGEHSPITDLSCEEAQALLNRDSTAKKLLMAALHMTLCTDCRKEILKLGKAQLN